MLEKCVPAALMLRELSWLDMKTTRGCGDFSRRGMNASVAAAVPKRFVSNIVCISALLVDF